jgi:hypothetical protein
MGNCLFYKRLTYVFWQPSSSTNNVTIEGTNEQVPSSSTPEVVTRALSSAQDFFEKKILYGDIYSTKFEATLPNFSSTNWES